MNILPERKAELREKAAFAAARLITTSKETAALAINSATEPLQKQIQEQKETIERLRMLIRDSAEGVVESREAMFEVVLLKRKIDEQKEEIRELEQELKLYRRNVTIVGNKPL